VETLAEQWSDWLRNPSTRARSLVAELAGAIVGFASFGPTLGEPTPDVGELYAIYVVPETSGCGVGQALMVEVLKRLRSEGFTEAILWALEDNPRTRRFYELAGWHEDGGSKDETWLGTLVREVRYRVALDPPR
jgi:GNAT superfamily N-acetyltransferase